MPLLVPTLRRLGGVAETRELRARGIRPAQLSAAVACGDVIRVRRGWYAVPDTPDDLVTAVRIGGRLACVSAAAHYGWATPEHHGVHVCVAENAARLRRPPTDPRLAGLRGGAIVHWGSPVARGDRPRLITSRFETVVQLVGCLDPEHAVAALDSFLHSEPELSAELEQWLSSLPAHLLARLSARSTLCESFLETIGRIRLEHAGIVGAHQVEIAGVGRVDLVSTVASSSNGMAVSTKRRMRRTADGTRCSPRWDITCFASATAWSWTSGTSSSLPSVLRSRRPDPRRIRCPMLQHHVRSSAVGAVRNSGARSACRDDTPSTGGATRLPT